MFKTNRQGKISCSLGVLAFILCFIAAFSTQQWVNDIDRQYLSPFINYLMLPIGYIANLFSTQEVVSGPTMQATSALYFFERDAVVAFFIIGIFISIASLYFSLKAVRKKEFSFWYANGAFFSSSGLFLLNIYAGSIYIIVSLVLAENARINK